MSSSSAVFIFYSAPQTFLGKLDWAIQVRKFLLEKNPSVRNGATTRTEISNKNIIQIGETLRIQYRLLNQPTGYKMQMTRCSFIFDSLKYNLEVIKDEKIVECPVTELIKMSIRKVSDIITEIEFTGKSLILNFLTIFNFLNRKFFSDLNF